MSLKKISGLSERSFGNELTPQSGKVIIVDDHPVALFYLDKHNYAAIDNTCPHRGGSLGNGTVENNIVTCPKHGWRFNCHTGENVDNPDIRVKRYEVKVEEGEITLEWPE